MAIGEGIDLGQLLGEGRAENASCGKDRSAVSAAKVASARERIIDPADPRRAVTKVASTR
jgi:hypothetical protein